jgi:hypothetical protein
MRMDILQSALLKWFWYEQGKFRSMQQIDSRCRILFEQFFPERPAKNAKYALFHPLVRSGLIEFYGDDRYCLAPTCALLSSGLILLVNLPAKLQQELEEITTPLMTELGHVLCTNSSSVFRFLNEKNIPTNLFQLEVLLREVPPIVKIIRTWEEDTVIDPNRFLYFADKWVNYPGNEYLGVFKKSGLSYAQRVCRIGSADWRIIPPLEKNIDAFYYAVLWSKANGQKSIGAAYCVQRSKLILHEPFFPLMLERLLIINTILHPGAYMEIKQRRYHVNKLQLRLLNKFLNNSIKISHE